MTSSCTLRSCMVQELVQNAEDAGAKVVKLMFDQATYGNTHLHNPSETARHQGPALYAYNDAMFTEDDWRGIRMLDNSVKVDDPMKVGRFGLGFKSVFHLTGRNIKNEVCFQYNNCLVNVYIWVRFRLIIRSFISFFKLLYNNKRIDVKNQD